MVFFLEQKLAMLSEQQNNLTDALHYIIGLFAYRNQQYRKAHSHFAQCISYDKDLYTQALLLETSSTEDSLAIATSIMPLLTNAAQCSKPRSRDEVAKKIIAHIFNSVHQHYVSQLLFRAKYTQAYQFASYLTELPDTHQAACNAFIKIENRIMKESEENYKKLVTIPYRIHTLTAFKKLAAQKNHPLCICDCLAFFLQEQIVCKWTDESIKNSLEEECLSHLYCGLQHKDISDHYKKSLLHVCGLLACHLGTTNKSLDLLDQAISFGNVTALYEKAMMLLTSPSVTNNIPEILDLFKKNAESNDPRSIKSIKQLAEYYHGKTGLDDKKQSFCYLTAAAEMNDYEMAPLLAYFYAHGIREKNGEWYLLPDSTKALHYLTQNIEQGNNRFLAQALNMRAMMYHKNNEFEKACDDLKEYISYELTHNQKAVSFWLMGLMQLHNNENNEPTTEIVNYFRAANKELENSFLSKTKLPDFLSYTNEESRKIIKEKVNSILSTNDTKLDSLDFCYLMSKFLFESTYRQPITNKDRIFAIAGLRYAAENNCFEAQLLLLQTDEKEVCLYDKIYYLETSLQKNPSLTIAIQPILDNLHPKTIELQAGLVNFYVEKGNEALATKYLSCMYENNSPVLNDPIYYRTFSYEQAIELINACAKNEFLVKFANNFVKNPRKSIPAEHFAAILWGSLLSYSIDEKQLMAAANYLQKACDNFPIIQMKYITNNLGQIYYKLGWRYTQKNSYKPLLAIAYLQKGAKLENSNSWKLLVKLWLEKVPEARSIDKKTILEYAYNANLREESSHSKELFQKCSAELCSENTNLPLIASIDFATSVMVDTNEQIMEKILEQKKQPSYSLLINAVSSREAIDQEFNKAVNLSDNIAENRMAIIDLYEKLAHRNNPHPHACMKLASLYFSQPSIKCDIIKRYLHDAIVHGLVHPAGKPNALFKDTVITNILFEFIHDVAYDQNRKYQGMILLKEIKKYLLEQKVNIAAFESLFKFTCSKDLTKHATWKQKK
jgi:TPR repeat protein